MKFTVRLAPEFATKISELISRIGAVEIKSGTEILGPLFGTRHDSLVTVQTFRMLPVHDLRTRRPEYFGRAFERLLAVSKSELSSLELIGWCCIRSTDSKGLLDTDAAFHNHRFSGTTDIALILRPDQRARVSVEAYAASPNGTISHAECYYGAGSFPMETPASGSLDFPLELKEEFLQDRASLQGGARAADRSRLASPPDAALAPVPQRGSESALSVFSSFRPNRLYWSLAVVVSVIAAGAMFLGLLHANSTTPVVNPPSASAPPPSASGVGMKVEAQQGDRLLITWNRESPMVQSAKYGILYIDDGTQHKEIVFAPGEMKNGSILYRPGSDEVTFRLQVLGRDDAMVTESVRVLDGSMAVALNANAQKPQMFTPEMRLTANRDMEELKPAKPYPLVTHENPLGSPNPVPELKKFSAARLESSTSSAFKPALSIAPPPKLSISTAPPVLSMDMHPLPQAPPPSSGSAVLGSSRSMPAYAPPRPLKQVLPNTNLLGSSEISGRKRVEVHVDIDKAGHVKRATVVKTGTDIPEALRDSVLQAASQWTFTPATLHGKPVASDHTIVFDFRPQGQ